MEKGKDGKSWCQDADGQKSYLAVLLRGPDKQLHHLSVVPYQGSMVAAGAGLARLADSICLTEGCPELHAPQAIIGAHAQVDLLQ